MKADTAKAKVLISLSLLNLFVILLIFSGSQDLHHSLHEDCGAPEHQCAITLLLHAEMEIAATAVSANFVPEILVIETAAPLSTFSPELFATCMERGPPARVG